MKPNFTKRVRFQKTLVIFSALLIAVSVLYGMKQPAVTLAQEVFCDQEEHIHDESCYLYLDQGTEENTNSASQEIILEDQPVAEEASAAVAASADEKTLICVKEEHIHDDSCKSNPNADVENSDAWNLMFSDLGLDSVSDNERYSSNLLAISRKQLDYAESSENYQIAKQADGSVLYNGYTRYGEWAEDPYGSWNTYFTGFSLEYAGIPADLSGYQNNLKFWIDDLASRTTDLHSENGLFIPSDYYPYQIVNTAQSELSLEDANGQGTFVETLQLPVSAEDNAADSSTEANAGVYLNETSNSAETSAASYTPYVEVNSTEQLKSLKQFKPGNIVFLDMNRNGVPDSTAVISSVWKNENDPDLKIQRLSLITGDFNNAVKTISIDVDDERIVGYFNIDALLPENTQASDYFVSDVQNVEENEPDGVNDVNFEQPLEESELPEEGLNKSEEESEIATEESDRSDEDTDVLRTEEFEQSVKKDDEMTVDSNKTAEKDDEQTEESEEPVDSGEMPTEEPVEVVTSDEIKTDEQGESAEEKEDPNEEPAESEEESETDFSNPAEKSEVPPVTDDSFDDDEQTLEKEAAENQESILENNNQSPETNEGTDDPENEGETSSDLLEGPEQEKNEDVDSTQTHNSEDTKYEPDSLNLEMEGSQDDGIKTGDSTDKVSEQKISKQIQTYFAAPLKAAAIEALKFQEEFEPVKPGTIQVSEMIFNDQIDNLDQRTFSLHNSDVNKSVGNQVSEISNDVKGLYRINNDINAIIWTFSKADNQQKNNYYISTEENGITRYMKMEQSGNSGSLTLVSGKDQASIFIAEKVSESNNQFTFKADVSSSNQPSYRYINFYYGSAGSSVAGWNAAGTHSQIALYEEVSKKAELQVYKTSVNNNLGPESTFIESVEYPEMFYSSSAQTWLIAVSDVENIFKGQGYSYENCSSWSPFYLSSQENTYKLTEYAEYAGQTYIEYHSSELPGFIYYLDIVKANDSVRLDSTVINFFDYRVNTNQENWNENGPQNTQGINSNHVLKFGSESSDSTGTLNKWTGDNGGVLQGIVNSTLSSEPYPQLSGNKQPNNQQSTESLAYLFDPGESDSEIKKTYRNVQNLMYATDDGYFEFDSTKRYAYLTERTGQNGSKTYAVEQYEPGLIKFPNKDMNGQFFPYNSPAQAVLNNNCTSDDLNHFFGMSLTTRFIQNYEGYTDSTKRTPTQFKFAGDDDVWIYIDNVLVADLGGIHDACEVIIDFAKGKVMISQIYGDQAGYSQETVNGKKYLTKHFTSIFNSDQLSSGTFVDGSSHVLRFFYLERGGNASNLKLQYNLTDIPATSIYKVDQLSNELAGAAFAVYEADANYNYLVDSQNQSENKDYVSKDQIETVDSDTGIITTKDNKTIKPAYFGTTDQNGEMIFRDDELMPLSMEELKAKFSNHFIIREVDVPPGYRLISDEIRMRIENNIMYCDNTFESGVLSSPNALVTAAQKLYYADLNEYDQHDFVDYYNPAEEGYAVEGTLFAVVLKNPNNQNTGSPHAQVPYDQWLPVYGNDLSGYHIVQLGEGAADNISAVIETAKIINSQSEKLYGNTVFEIKPAGMQVLLEKMPGDPKKYYTIIDEDQNLTGPADYAVAYYYTTEDSLEKANTGNTRRVVSHKDIMTDYDGFYVQWGSTIEIPNIENRIFFQKKDEQGNLMNDAVFAMYNAGETKDGTLFYKGTDSSGHPAQIVLVNDLNEKNEGTAYIVGDQESLGTYSINTVWNNFDPHLTEGLVKDPGAGVITVRIGNKTYTISPFISALDDRPRVGITHNSCNIVNEDGTGHFGRLLKGEYVLREIKAPKGYLLNPNEVKIVVTEYDIWANAGIEGDGISVGNGPGYLPATMNMYASEGAVDDTLMYIYSVLKGTPDTTFAGLSQNTAEWKYLSRDDLTTKPSPQYDGYGTRYNQDTVSNAMVTYLEFSTNKSDGYSWLFDYHPSDKQNSRTGDGEHRSTAEGQDKIRLYAETGWAIPEIYQDYLSPNRSRGSGSNGTVDYTDLRDQNIQNLFSHSIFIQVSDMPGLDITLIKKDSGSVENKRLENAEFILAREAADSAELPDPNENQDENQQKQLEYYSVNEVGKITWLSSKDAAYKFTTNGNGNIFIPGLKQGSYSLIETEAPDGYGILKDPVEFAVQVETDGSNKKTLSVVCQDNPAILLNDNAQDDYPDDYNKNRPDYYQYAITVGNSKLSDLSIGFHKMIKTKDSSGYVVKDIETAKFRLYYEKQSVELDQANEVKMYYAGYNEYSDSTSDSSEYSVKWTEDVTQAYEFTGAEFDINGLDDGVYYLEEFVLPVGCMEPDGVIEISVKTTDEVKTVTVKNTGFEYAAEILPVTSTPESSEITTMDQDGKDGSGRYIIVNRSIILPETGGEGRCRILIPGVILLAGTGILWILYEKSRKNRTGEF